MAGVVLLVLAMAVVVGPAVGAGAGGAGGGRGAGRERDLRRGRPVYLRHKETTWHDSKSYPQQRCGLADQPNCPRGGRSPHRLAVYQYM